MSLFHNILPKPRLFLLLLFWRQFSLLSSHAPLQTPKVNAIYNLRRKLRKLGRAVLRGVCFQQQTFSLCHRNDCRAMTYVKKKIPSMVLLMSVLKQKLYTWGQWAVVFISILFYAVLWSNMKIITIYEIRQQTRPWGVLCYVTLHPIQYFVTLFLK